MGSVKLKALDPEKFKMVIEIADEEEVDKVLRLLFVAGIKHTKPKGSYSVEIKCTVNTEEKYERIIRCLADWLGTTEGMIMSSPIFKRYLRRIHEKANKSNRRRTS